MLYPGHWAALCCVCLLTWTCRSGNAKVSSCDQRSSCSCMTESGLIDLQPLSGKEQAGLKTSKFQNDYYYNPCKNINIGRLRNAGAALHESIGDLWYQIGDNKNAKLAVDGDNVVLTTSFGSRSTRITLKCNARASSPSFVLSSSEDFKYNFDLESQHCCPGRTPSPNDDTEEQLSIGTIICIAFLVVIIVYLVVGTLIQVFVRKSKGLETLPNVHFWMTFPGLVKDGFLFILSCLKRPNYGRI